MKRSLAITLLTALLPLTSALAAAPKVGDAAPDFTLQGSDGRTHKLSDLRGKKAVVLAWFPKAFTGGCTAECQSLKDISAQIQSSNVALFAASVDDAETNRKFAESLKLDYPILSDPTKKTAEAYGVLNDRGMASRWTIYIGKDGKIAAIDQSVQPTSHGKTVAEQVKKLGLAK
jgi:peroxiredoxin Q/BCP